MKHLLTIVCFIILHSVTFSVEAYNSNNLKSVSVSNVNIKPNVKQKGQNGILITFDCNASGYKGYPIFFYSYFLHGDDLSKVKKHNGKNVYGFSCSTAIYDNTAIKRISHFVPYKDLPSKYHGYLAVRIVVVDHADNIIFRG